MNKKMKVFYQAGRNSLRGIVSGSMGGLTAGLLFGLAMTMYYFIGLRRWPESLFEVIFPYVSGALLAGLIGGSLLGGLVGVTVTVTRPYLLGLSRILGGIVATIPSLFLLNSDMLIIVIIVIVGSAVLAGVVGGTAAFRCYEWLFE